MKSTQHELHVTGHLSLTRCPLFTVEQYSSFLDATSAIQLQLKSSPPTKRSYSGSSAQDEVGGLGVVGEGTVGVGAVGPHASHVTGHLSLTRCPLFTVEQYSSFLDATSAIQLQLKSSPPTKRSYSGSSAQDEVGGLG
jgi:hypothetical protein